MAYTRFLGKRVIAGSKYVVGYAEPPALFEGWTNVSFNTFTSSGLNVTSAISLGPKGYADTEKIYLEATDTVRVDVSELIINSGSYPTNGIEIHLCGVMNWPIGTFTPNPVSLPGGVSYKISDYDGAGYYFMRIQNYDQGTPHACNVSLKMHIYKI